MSWTRVQVVVDGEAAEAVAEALRPFAYGGVSLGQAVIGRQWLVDRHKQLLSLFL